MTLEVVDAQVHLNQLGIEASIAAMDSVGVDAAIIDQWPVTRTRLANGAFRYAYRMSEEAVRRFPHRFAYMMRLDPADPDLEALMAMVRQRPNCLGVRVDQPPESLLAGGAYDRFFELAGRHNVPVWIILPGRMGELASQVRRFTDVQFVVDHAGMPLRWNPSDPGRFQPLDQLLALASFPNVAAKWGHMTKLSAEPFPYQDVLRQLSRTLETFGRERVMWESDFTMCTGYQTWAESLFSIRVASELSESDKEWVLGRATRTVMRWERQDDRVDVIAVGEGDWTEFHEQIARRGRFLNGRVKVLRVDASASPTLKPGGRCISTVTLAGAERVTLDEAVAAAITGSRLTPLSEVPIPPP